MKNIITTKGTSLVPKMCSVREWDNIGVLQVRGECRSIKWICMGCYSAIRSIVEFHGFKSEDTGKWAVGF